MGLVFYKSATAYQQGSVSGEFTIKSIPVMRKRFSFTLYALVGLACIFFIPYLVPVKPAFSLSYAFGFNNDAGILLLLGFCTIGALWQRRGPLFSLVDEPDVPVNRRTLLIGLLLTGVICVLAYPLVSRAIPVADAAYFVDRMQLLHAGKLPYVDFEFAYGPILLYVPFWIAELFRLPNPTGYYIFWVINELIGVFIVARVLNAIDISTRVKPAIFLLFCAASCTVFVLGGVNYTLFRFALAPFLAIQIFEVDRKMKNRRQAIWIVALLVILSFALLELVSPELGLAFGAGYAGFLLLGRGGRASHHWITLAVTLVGFAGILWIANWAHLLDTMKAFGGGGRSIPFVLSGPLILFMYCVFLACLHLARSWPRWGESNSCLFILVSIPMVVSALNFCDPPHIFYSGIGLLAIGMIYLSGSKVSWDLTRQSGEVHTACYCQSKRCCLHSSILGIHHALNSEYSEIHLQEDESLKVDLGAHCHIVAVLFAE